MCMAVEVKTAGGVPFGNSSLDGLGIWITEATTGYIRDTSVISDFVLANIVSWM